MQMGTNGKEKKYINVDKEREKYSQRARNTRLKEAENMKSDFDGDRCLFWKWIKRANQGFSRVNRITNVTKITVVVFGRENA